METDCESDQMSDITANGFQRAITNTVTELKETTVQEVKGGVVTMSHQTENSKKMEIITVPSGNSWIEK